MPNMPAKPPKKNPANSEANSLAGKNSAKSQDAKPAEISVVMPAYNASRTIRECLEAITSQDFAQGYEVIVVNDGSTDNTAEIVRGFGNVKLISQENAGPASARNNGAKNAKGSIVVFIDSDCIAQPNFLKEISRPFSDADVSGVQGAYLCRNKQLMERFGQLEIEQRYERMKKRRFIDFMGSYAAAYGKNVFLEFGGFDESFPVASGEDTDLSFRISSAGHKFVFNPKANVYHFHPDSLRKYLRVKFFRGYWRVLVYRKHKKKVLADAYTSQTIKAQVGAFYLMCASLVLAALWPVMLYAAGALFLLLVLSTLRFFAFALPRDAAVAFASIPIQLLRTAMFASGLLYGIAKASARRM